jgi:hypothetical protein
VAPVPSLPSVTATRYVLPLREGGSLPALMEADDLGTYVVKFHGAGQGRKALVAEIVAGELGRALGLRVPDLVRVDLPAGIAPGEPDQEVQDLLRASVGLNLGMDYLPGSFGFDPVADHVDADLAARVVVFDALVLNVDRSWRNPNLLLWHKDLWLIDHGATLFFHHAWPRDEAGLRRFAERTYDVRDHVLGTVAGSLQVAADELLPRVTPELLRGVTALVPDEWLADEPGFDTPGDVREAYVGLLASRAAHAPLWVPALEADRAAG